MPLRKLGSRFTSVAAAITLTGAFAVAVPSTASAANWWSWLAPTKPASTPAPAPTPTPEPAPVEEPVAEEPTPEEPAPATDPVPAEEPVAATDGEDGPTGACPTKTTTQAFAKIGDTHDYTPAPNGDFELGSAGWSLSWAKIANGNENLGISPGKRSLAMGTGLFASSVATALSPSFCIDSTHPYFRYVMKANGPVGLLATYIVYKSESGQIVSSAVQSAVSTSLFPGKWKASDLNPLSIKIPLLNNGGKSAQVQIMFVSPLSILGTSYFIDNLMVDPYRRG